MRISGLFGNIECLSSFILRWLPKQPAKSQASQPRETICHFPQFSCSLLSSATPLTANILSLSQDCINLEYLGCKWQKFNYYLKWWTKKSKSGLVSGIAGSSHTNDMWKNLSFLPWLWFPLCWFLSSSGFASSPQNWCQRKRTCF